MLGRRVMGRYVMGRCVMGRCVMGSRRWAASSLTRHYRLQTVVVFTQ
jgi:hypothetical protein